MQTDLQDSSHPPWRKGPSPDLAESLNSLGVAIRRSSCFGHATAKDYEQAPKHPLAAASWTRLRRTHKSVDLLFGCRPETADVSVDQAISSCRVRGKRSQMVQDARGYTGKAVKRHEGDQITHL